jgi:probable phosphoglycerate mutase
MTALKLPPLYILRHGETEWNLEGRLQGALNSPLTHRGKQQAMRQGQILDGLDLHGTALLCSPQCRAVQTASIALAARASDLRLDDRLREIGLGLWAGSLLRDLPVPADGPSGTPNGMALYDMAPQGEGLAALEVRCRGFLEGLTDPCVLVTHSITSRMMRALATGAGRAGLDLIGCGQGVVYHLHDGVQIRLE